MSSRRAERRRSCHGKVRYADEAPAGLAAVTARRRTGELIVPYRCRFCGGWHVGHPPAEVRQAMAARRAR